MELLDSPSHQAIQEFSDNFLSLNGRALQPYSGRKWVRDPYHQWSRQWEYPYVFSKISSMAEGSGPKRILDAGSGITFFPYYVGSCFKSAQVHASDHDRNLARIYQLINSRSPQKVDFCCGDLGRLPYSPGWFDIVYCISVFEHIPASDWGTIIEGFSRIIRPAGRLLLTFDLALEAWGEINLSKASLLLDLLCERFELEADLSPDLASQASDPDAFTTLVAKDIDVGLLPWKFPGLVYRIESALSGKRINSWPPLLTVVCITLTKPMHDGCSSH
jgi:hypothetical protein